MLDLFTPLPDLAPSRTKGPATSAAAAEGLRNLTARHRAVWECLRALGPSADWQLEDAYDTFGREPWWTPQTSQSIRSRRAMLARYGLVVTDGRRVPSPNGYQSRVWAAVDPGRAKRLLDSR